MSGLRRVLHVLAAVGLRHLARGAAWTARRLSDRADQLDPPQERRRSDPERAQGP